MPEGPRVFQIVIKAPYQKAIFRWLRHRRHHLLNTLVVFFCKHTIYFPFYSREPEAKEKIKEA